MTSPTRDAADEIAIVGMAGVFPGAADVGQFWDNVLNKVCAISEAPADWRADLFCDPGATSVDRVYTAAGGFLKGLAVFDPLAHGVMPNSIDGSEPDQFMALQVASEALADAGYANKDFDRQRTEVILGRGTNFNRGYMSLIQRGFVIDQTLGILRSLHPEHSEAEIATIRAALSAQLPALAPEVVPGLVPNVMCGRVMNRLDLMGASYTVDAACASALVALDTGCRDLLAGRCDMALVGGVQVHTPALVFMVFCQLEALSRSGRVRPFSKHADGTLLGEGLGMVVLKRKADACRDGDRIYALVKGVGIASDGRALGLLAPRLEGEVLAMRRAYAQTNIRPDTLGLLEAHGTGTRLGDATEIRALREIFGERQRNGAVVAMGSVKSMIGHIIPASAIASVIKMALALYHRVLPPMLCDEPNPELGIERSALYLNTETRPWVHGAREPRRAGVNAFGFGGINAHAILEENLA